MLKRCLINNRENVCQKRTKFAFNSSKFALYCIALVTLPIVAYGQGSMQRLVRISGDNGNIVSLSAGNPAATYTLTLPPNINPSTNAASVLFGSGSGLLDWTPAATTDSGNVIQLIDVGSGVLKPRWVSPAVFSAAGNYWAVAGNSPVSAWDGTSGSYLGTTNAVPLVIATTNTSSAQPIEFFTDNTERMRIAPDGEVGIGVTPSSGVLLHVGGTAGTANVRFNSLSGANLPLVFGANEGLLVADANGDLTKRDPSVLQNNYVQYDISSQQAQSTDRSHYLFNVAYDTAAGDASAAGALILSEGGATNRNATALTLNASASGVGSATGLNVTASGGAMNNAIDATGNIRLLSSGGTASSLSLQNPAGTFSSTFTAGAQTTNLNYTLPTSAPTAGQVLSSDASGTLSWATPFTGSFVNYNTATPQSGADITAGNYLFNIGYAASATNDDAPGATITSASGTSGNTNATGLTLTSTANGTGTATGLDVSASGGSTNNAIDATGDIRLLSSGGNASSLVFQNPAATFTSTFTAGAQTVNLNYTLPTTAPTAGQVLSSDASGVLSWATPSTGSFVNYNTSAPQNTASIVGGNYLFNVGYAGSATTNNALGATITSTSGTGGNTNATGLAITSTANGTGTSTALSVTAAGGTTKNAVDATGNIRLLSSGGTASTLSFQNPAGTFASTFTAGAQTANINYTLPLTAPTAGQMLSSTAGGALSWVDGVTGSGTATRIAFWGPGPGVTSNLMDDANLYWDNTNDRLSIASGTTPSTPLHVTLNDTAQSTSQNVATFDHTTSGTPATGFGEAINFRLQTGTGGSAQTRDAGKIGTVWRTASDTYRTSDLTFSTVDSGTTSEKVRITGEGYVGVNNTDPNFSMDITGAYGTRATTITLTSSADNNNINIGNSSYVRIVGPTGPFTITGMGPGYDGKRVRMANLTGYDWTVVDSGTSSTAGSRFVTGTNSNVTIKGPVSVLDFIYDGPTSQWFLGTLNANQLIGAVGSLVYAYKTADESVTNSTVIQDDDHLSFYVNAGESWEINGEIETSNPSNNIDIKCAFEVPSNAGLKIMYTGIQDAGGNAIQGNGQFTTSNGTKTVQINGGVSTLITFRGIVRATTTSGYIKFRWSQGTASLTSPTSVKQLSYLKITRVQ